MLKPTTSTSERDGFVSGGTTEATAVGAVIRFADGTATKAPLVVPGDTQHDRWAVLRWRRSRPPSKRSRSTSSMQAGPSSKRQPSSPIGTPSDGRYRATSIADSCRRVAFRSSMTCDRPGGT